MGQWVDDSTHVQKKSREMERLDRIWYSIGLEILVLFGELMLLGKKNYKKINAFFRISFLHIICSSFQMLAVPRREPEE